MPNTNISPLSPGDALSRHRDYYIPGGDLHFLFRQTHFRVHSYFFRRESKYWRARLAGPVSPGDEPKQPGTHESTAFVVDEDPQDFAHFLWVFYNPKYSLYHAPLSKWIAILRLASLWGCSEICDLAVSFINEIPGMGTMQKIKIYQDSKVERRHLLPLYLELAAQEEMLGREEFRILDADTLFSIVRAREMLRAPFPADGGGRDSLKSPLREDHTEDDMFNILAIAFGISTEQIQALKLTGERPDAEKNRSGSYFR